MINWKKIKYFTMQEFPENPDLYAHPRLIKSLDILRLIVNKSIYPSPIKGALARFKGSKTSQHYAVKRLATGVDVFCEGRPIDILHVLLELEYFKGIGLYLNTQYNHQPWVMFHLDIREKGFSIDKPLLWIAIKNKNKKTIYLYPQIQGLEDYYLKDPCLFIDYKKEVQTC